MTLKIFHYLWSDSVKFSPTGKQTSECGCVDQELWKFSTQRIPSNLKSGSQMIYPFTIFPASRSPCPPDCLTSDWNCNWTTCQVTWSMSVRHTPPLISAIW